jgi:hypothetical protein
LLFELLNLERLPESPFAIAPLLCGQAGEYRGSARFHSLHARIVLTLLVGFWIEPFA